MTSSLYWKPAYEYGESLPDELKYALRKNEDGDVHVVMTKDDLPYLNGLKHGSVKGAKELIAIIREHGEVRLDERY